MVRKLALVVLGLSGIVAAPAGASGPSPPVIRESFTLLPCPATPQTTLDLEGCAEHRIVATDKQINAVAKTVFAALPDVAARRRFVAGERAWLAYRRAGCLSEADVHEGGSLSSVDFANCVVTRNLEHLKDLKAFLHALRTP